MKIVIDNNTSLDDAVALDMVKQVLKRPDGSVRFTKGYVVVVKETKTQKSFKITADM